MKKETSFSFCPVMENGTVIWKIQSSLESTHWLTETEVGHKTKMKLANNLGRRDQNLLEGKTLVLTLKANSSMNRSEDSGAYNIQKCTSQKTDLF